MSRIKRYFALGASLLVSLFVLVGFVTTGASATTLTCTQTANTFVTPYGCGGLESQFAGRGSLSLAVLGTSTVNNVVGNYSNSPVGVKLTSLTDTTQDFTVFAINGLTNGGEGDLGSYVAMYTPNGHIPGGCTLTGPCSATNDVVKESPLDFCISVQDYYPIVRHQRVQRWRTVLRNCFISASDPNRDVFGTPGFVLGNGTNPNAVTNPNLYQTWSPTTGSVGLFLVNKALHYPWARHGWGSNAPYVLDDTAFGGSGTQSIAFPENDGINQLWQILGCTPPVTDLNTQYQLCP